MTERGYPTPEEAAQGDTPARYAPVLDLSVHENRAVVLLGTNGPPDIYPYEVHCFREGDQWYEGSGSNGCGWSGGVMTLWSQMPMSEDVTEAVIESRGCQHRVPVKDGYFLFVEFDWPDSDDMDSWPRVVAVETRQ